MKKSLSLSIFLFATHSIFCAVQMLEMSNKSDLNAYVSVQTVNSSADSQGGYLVLNQILPGQTRQISYELDGLPKRIGISLGYKPNSWADLNTYLINARKAERGMQFVIAPVKANLKTLTLVKSGPYVNGILARDFILYPISNAAIANNVTALDITKEKQSEVSAPPSYRPLPPVQPITKPQETLMNTNDLTAPQKRDYVKNLLSEIRNLTPSNKPLWDKMTREELSQEYFRLSNELEHNEFADDVSYADAQFKQLFADIEYVRRLLQNK
ncbi:hypothetical protein Noda2021_02480 [Candidatus Dependentiae bacterium Noda2021]|nr:hypothetical protein Noda2021_02480 [Candidatus Dependentiae bacterium Noda2021]